MKTIRVVIDTNILISSLWGGKPRQIIDLWDKGDIVLVVSQDILNEYFEVLNRFSLSEEDIEDITILFSNSEKAIVIKPKVKHQTLKNDPDDEKFVDCAIEGGAQFIISGDKHLLELKTSKYPTSLRSGHLNS
ncbi:MAG: putative toxin-antitoxin system toxin component, PIN family [Elusimicrobia bacterium]|nr:putative toxin-antitoxin system toxin component, PIN family [Elusimicrobiota bacterium]